MITRRAFIWGLAGATVPSPMVTSAQTPAKARRIGLLMTTTPAAASHIAAAFADGLRELGHIEGKTVVLEYRWAEGRPERFAELVADLVRQPVDVIVASSQAPALAAKRAMKTIPIVMVNAADPVQVGLVASLARPGGNVTGLSQQLTPEIQAKQLQLLKEVLPKGSRAVVAVLRSPATTVGLREYETAGQALKLRVQFVEVRSRDDLERAFAAMARDRVDALLVPGDTFLFTERQRVAELARARRLPGIYSSREFTEAGGLMSYSARLTEQFRRAAACVGEVIIALGVANPSIYILSLGLPGFWFILVSWRALGNPGIPKHLLILGFLWGVGNLLTVIAHVFVIIRLIRLVTLGASVFAPMWSIAEGLYLLKLSRAAAVPDVRADELIQ